MMFDYKLDAEEMKGLQKSDMIYTFDSMVLEALQTPTDSLLNTNNTDFRANDCIMVNAATGLRSLDDWTSKDIGGYELTFSNEQKITIGKYDVHKRRLTANMDNIAYDQAFIQLPEDVSYYIRTCNTNSEQDLNTILQHFAVKGV